MPQNTKRIVTTVGSGPLGEYLTESILWIGFNYKSNGDQPDNGWDVAVMSDNVVPADGKVHLCAADSVLIWLQHQSGPKNQKQETWIRTHFPDYELKIIPFSHGTDTNNWYLIPISRLIQPMEEADYLNSLAQIDRRFFGQDLVERSVAFLYTLARAIECNRVFDTDPYNAANRDAACSANSAVEHAAGVLSRALERHGEAGNGVKVLVQKYTGMINLHAGVTVEQFCTIRNTLRDLCYP